MFENRLSDHNFFESIISKRPAAQWGHEVDFLHVWAEPTYIFIFKTLQMSESWRELDLGKQDILNSFQVCKAYADEA